MMKILLNGEAKAVPADTRLDRLLTEMNTDGIKKAVIVNDCVISQNRWTALVLEEDDTVDVLIFAGGG